MSHHDITIPRDLLQATLWIVACKTQLIMDLKCLNEGEKRLAINDMIDRQIKQLMFASEFEETR